MFSIIDYKTGWDYGVIKNKIKAHAPSRIEIECLKDAHIELTPRVDLGGKAIATPRVLVNSREGKTEYQLRYEETLKLDLEKSDSLIMLFEVDKDNKTRCWNYWETNDINLSSIPAVYMEDHSRLGDSIAFLIGLENIARKNNINKIRVCKKQIYKDILECFNFKRVVYVEEEGSNLDSLFGSTSWDKPWILRLAESMSEYYGLNYPEEIKIPKCLVKENREYANSICIQLDSRSAKNLNKEKVFKFLELMRNDRDIIALGGKETKPYENSSIIHSLGDVKMQISALLCCDIFIGVDSGIGHLAGILGTKSYIINLIEQKTVAIFFGDYENTGFINRDLIEEMTWKR